MFSFFQVKAKLAAPDEPDADPAPTTSPRTLDNSTQALVETNMDMLAKAFKSLEIGKVWKLLTCPLAAFFLARFFYCRSFHFRSFDIHLEKHDMYKCLFIFEW